METKVCTKCREEKPTNDFSPHPTISNGNVSYCKLCVASISLKYYYEHKAERKKYTKSGGRIIKIK